MNVKTLRDTKMCIRDSTYANYDIAAVEADYEKAADELSRAQLALDAVNQRETFELEE